MGVFVCGDGGRGRGGTWKLPDDNEPGLPLLPVSSQSHACYLKALSFHPLLFLPMQPTGRFTTVRLRGKRPGCVACGEQPAITRDTLPTYDYVAFTGGWMGGAVLLIF